MWRAWFLQRVFEKARDRGRERERKQWLKTARKNGNPKQIPFLCRQDDNTLSTLHASLLYFPPPFFFQKKKLYHDQWSLQMSGKRLVEKNGFLLPLLEFLHHVLMLLHWKKNTNWLKTNYERLLLRSACRSDSWTLDLSTQLKY